MKPEPPKRALRFLRWFCREDYLEEIEGDLVEIFEKRFEYSPAKAKRGFAWSVLKYFRPGFIRAFHQGQYSNNTAMLKNYFKISWRNLIREKRYATISIGGLAIGITCFVAIALYVNHELTYDRHFENAGQIYRVYTHETGGEEYQGSDNYATIPIPLATAMREEFSEILELTSFEPQSALLKTEQETFDEYGIWVDENFLDVFTLQFIQGNPATALMQPESMVLTRSLAEKLYGTSDPIGKQLTRQIRNDEKVFVVTGVIEDLPEKTSFKFSFLAPHRSRLPYQNAWDTSNSHTFMRLAEGTDPVQIEEKMLPLLERHQQANGWKNLPEEEYFLQPLSAYHLENGVLEDIGLKANPDQLSILAIVGVLVLLLACINYMNLAIARSMSRAREVGVRKVIGARRRQLVTQFLSESVLFASLALIIALGVLVLLLPPFSVWVERPLRLSLNEVPYLAPGLIVLVLLIGLVSGSYPAFFMSALQPIKSLKGKLKMSGKNFSLQRLLTIVQYVVSIIMVTGSLVIYKQYNFIQHADVGYDREHIVSVRIPDFPSEDEYLVLKNQWLSHPNILGVTASTYLPIDIKSSTTLNDGEGEGEEPLVMYRNKVDADFLKVFDIELISAGVFYEEASNSSNKLLLLNETACKALGWELEESIGQRIAHRGRVVGVIKDFHQFSLHYPIKPLMLQLNNEARLEYLSVKVRPGDLSETLNLLEESVSDYSEFPFEYRFLDDEFDQLYKSEIRLGEMLGFFTLVSVLIASMGLFGLAVFMANQRTKEIGIRKVLGASFNQLTQLLSGELLSVIFMSVILAIPIAWYLTKSWLVDYAYRIDLEWWMFALPGALVITLAFLTISQQTFRVARVNPIECLKDE
ncbi:MAG: ABC transporter permease [Roseivirga sp.]